MDTNEDAKRQVRRRHDRELKQQVLAECAAPGKSVAQVAMAHGLNANLVKGSMDNTELAQLMRLTLFGRTIPVSGLVADDASRSSSPALR